MRFVVSNFPRMTLCLCQSTAVLVFLLGLVVPVWTDKGTRDLTLEPGHLQRFGSGRPNHPVDEIDGFPNPELFFRKYVHASRPLKMKGAAIDTAAFKLWTDNYFMSLDIDTNSTVFVESAKKENRSGPSQHIHFKKFLETYNSSDNYMVQDVPVYLRKDVMIPCNIQCAELFEKGLVATIMWFSSGGTKSVIHTDAVDNMNCLYRGEKELYFVDPKYKNKIFLRENGAYSDIDVDRMDYTKYPELADIEYHHVNITAGDCLFIPYLWIHQVRSYGSNLAVNIWWNHDEGLKMDPQKCKEKCDQNLNLSQVNFEVDNENPEEDWKDYFLNILEEEDIKLEDMTELVLGNAAAEKLKNMNAGQGYLDVIHRIFNLFDSDGDEKITKEEVEIIPEKTWIQCETLMYDLDLLIEAIEKSHSKSHEEL